MKRLAALTGAVAALILAPLAVGDGQTTPSTHATVTVGAPTGAPPIPSGFLGISMEYQSAAATAGPADDPDTVFEQLVRNLNPGQQPVLRIGGDSTDHTWWPTPVIKHPSPALTFKLTPAWVQSIARVTQDLDAKLILGINLEANSYPLAQTEASEMIKNGIPHSAIEAMELGNEPSLYGAFFWYKDGTKLIPGRPRSWNFSTYVSDYKRISAAVQHVSLAGPALGAAGWMKDDPQLLRAVPRVGVVTYHAYPGSCYGKKGTPQYPSIANLLSNADSFGLADLVAPFAKVAIDDGKQFRVDEANTEACGGEAGVSNTFASALWALSTMFAFASKGISGVNVHTFPSAAYRLFGFDGVDGHWTARVAPEYYGLLAFANAAPAGSRLLKTGTTGDSSLQSWATTLNGTTRVTLINESTAKAASVTLKVPDTSSGTLAYLTAPSVRATEGVTLGGLGFGSSTSTGTPAGTSDVQPATGSGYGTYTVTVPAGAAAILSLS